MRGGWWIHSPPHKAKPDRVDSRVARGEVLAGPRKRGPARVVQGGRILTMLGAHLDADFRSPAASSGPRDAPVIRSI